MEEKPRTAPPKKRIFLGEELSVSQILLGLILGIIIGLYIPMMGITFHSPSLKEDLPKGTISGKPHEFSGTASWLNGMQGYERALEEQQKTGKPIFLYFYAPWCHYCRQFNLQIMNQKKIQALLATDFLSVRVYPQNNKAAFALFRQYGGSAYPSVFIKQSPTSKALKIEPFKAVEGGWLMKSPKEFSQNLKEFARSESTE